jgi:hypothetical protein
MRWERIISSCKSKIIAFLKVAVSCLLIIMAGLSISCRSKADKVDTIMEDGVKVVLNHLDPYVVPGEPRTLVLKRLFSIDTKDDKVAAAGLTDIYLFDVDESGMIFIMRSPANPGDLVFGFTKEGEFLRAFGPLGQGPGELEYPNAIFAREGMVGVVESPKDKLSYFDAAGTPTGTVSWDLGIDELMPVDASGYLASGRKLENKRAQFIPLFLGLVDKGMKSIKELERYSSCPNLPLVASFPEKTINGLGKVFLGTIAGGRVYAGSDERGYEIRVYDLAGKLIKKIRKEYAPVPVSRERRSEIMKFWEGMPDADKVFISSNWPPYKAFFGNDEGFLFVMTYEPGEKPGESLFDIFDSNGRFIVRKSMNASSSFSGAPGRIRGNRLYSIQEDKDGYKSLVVDEMFWE